VTARDVSHPAVDAGGVSRGHDPSEFDDFAALSARTLAEAAGLRP